MRCRSTRGPCRSRSGAAREDLCRSCCRASRASRGRRCRTCTCCLGTPAALLLPLAGDSRRFGLLAVGVAVAVCQTAGRPGERRACRLPAGPGTRSPQAARGIRARHPRPADFVLRPARFDARPRARARTALRCPTRLFAARSHHRLVARSRIAPAGATLLVSRLVSADGSVGAHRRPGRSRGGCDAQPARRAGDDPQRGHERLHGAVARMPACAGHAGVRGCPHRTWGRHLAPQSRRRARPAALQRASNTSSCSTIVTQSRRELEQLFASIAAPHRRDRSQRRHRACKRCVRQRVGEPAERCGERPLSCVRRFRAAAWVGSSRSRLPGTEVTDARRRVLGGPYVVTATDLLTETGSVTPAASSSRAIFCRLSQCANGKSCGAACCSQRSLRHSATSWPESRTSSTTRCRGSRAIWSFCERPAHFPARSRRRSVGSIAMPIEPRRSCAPAGLCGFGPDSAAKGWTERHPAEGPRAAQRLLSRPTHRSRATL